MAPNQKLFSIIIPAYNAEEFIGEALESVRVQSYQSWEIIVVNDGGTDGTPGIVAEFARRVPQKIVTLQHDKSRGPSAARNTGMSAAKGEYIALLDADDYWTPDHLACLETVLASGTVDMVYSDALVFRNSSSGEIEILSCETIEAASPATELFRRHFINPSAVAMTRRLMDRVGGFDTALPRCEDLDYWIRAAAQGFQIVPTGKRTCYYRKSPGTLTTNVASLAEEGARVFEKHSRCGILPENEILTKARDEYFAAGRLYWRRNPSAASRAFWKSWTLRKTGLLPLLCAVFTSALAWRQKESGPADPQHAARQERRAS